MNHSTKVTAAELALAQIRVNAVLPGLMKTPMVANSAFGAIYGEDLEAIWHARDAQAPLGHLGDAWDTGVELMVDGGQSLSCA